MADPTDKVTLPPMTRERVRALIDAEPVNRDDQVGHNAACDQLRAALEGEGGPKREPIGAIEAARVQAEPELTPQPPALEPKNFWCGKCRCFVVAEIHEDCDYLAGPDLEPTGEDGEKCSECGRVDCPWHMPDIDALQKAASDIEAFEDIAVKEWSELLLNLLAAGFEVNPAQPPETTKGDDDDWRPVTLYRYRPGYAILRLPPEEAHGHESRRYIPAPGDGRLEYRVR